MKITKNRDGISTVQKKIAPRLSIHYSAVKVVTDTIIPVNGHKRRCLAIEKKWNETFQIDNGLFPIVLIDIAEHYNSIEKRYKKRNVASIANTFVVEITDTILAYKDANVVINYNIGLEQEEIDSRYLLGSYWFFFDDTRYQTGLSARLGNLVLIIPNGNKEKFYEAVDIGDIVRILNENNGGWVRICENLDTETFDRFAVSADLVITTPSTTAMELATLNKPMLLVKTSEDQTGDFSTIAETYTDDMFRLLLKRKDVREVYGRNDIKNNIDKVVNKIYETWEKWYYEQN